MVESRMAEDETGRPVRFSPNWPPKVAEKPLPVNFPGCSMVFRKSSWPPPTAEEINTLEGNTDGSAATEQNDSSQQQPSVPAQNNSSNNQNSISSQQVKPKRAVKDSSFIKEFYGKNAKEPAKPAYILQPGGLKIPDKFSGNPEDNE